jgi:hypothetical protein
LCGSSCATIDGSACRAFDGGAAVL